MTTGSGRSRRAELARPSSDVTRHRGVVAAGVACALVVIAALAARDGPRALTAPGPLSGSHTGAACSSCHRPSAERATCSGCHAPHPSRRAAHATLAHDGALTCGSCHALHEPGSSVALAPENPSSPERFVPLVAAQVCVGCHAATDPRDPAAPCLGAGASLCFDEHRRPGSASTASAASRDADVERARVLVRAGATRSSLWSSALGTALCLGLGLGTAAFGLTLVRRRRARTTPRVPRALPGARRLPVIDAQRCLGCGACVDACPYDALEVRRYVAVLTRPDACCGAGPCLPSCPNGSLRLVEGETPNAGPRLSPGLESLERPGLFLAGDMTGGTLIRNALRQGTEVAHAVADRLGSRKGANARPASELWDLLVVGAGPAGLAAGLTASSLGLSVLLLDQAGVAASIRRFSREKLVLDTPHADDEKLPLFVGDAKKEELIERWLLQVRRARLEVREGVRVLGVARKSAADEPFVISAQRADDAPATYRARHVLLAAGSRGSPRLLDVPVADVAVPRVHYELSDARAFAGRRAVILGLGDVAMETALALAAQPGSELTVVHRGSGFRRGSQRNIDALSALVAKGRVTLVLGAQVTRVLAAALEVDLGTKRTTLPYDALFVHLGSVRSSALLESCGLAQ